MPHLIATLSSSPFQSAFQPAAHLKHPTTHKIWGALKTQQDEVTVGDVKLKNPVLLAASPDSDARALPSETQNTPANPTPPSEGFVLGGDVVVFGVPTLVGRMRSWHGPFPPSIGHSSAPPIYQHAELDKVSLTTLLPFLPEGPFKKLELSNVLITYQSHIFDHTKAVGWHIDADVTLGVNHGNVYKLLSNVLGLKGDHLSFHVHAALGDGHSWNSVPSIQSFCLEGILQTAPTPSDGSSYTGIQLCKGVRLSNVGVRFLGIGKHGVGKTASASMSYGFAVFGELTLSVPGSTVPLHLDYDIGEIKGVAVLNASLHGDVWTNALGLGIDLYDVSMSCDFAFGAPLRTFDIAIDARFVAGSIYAEVQGSYTSAGDWFFRARIEDVDWKSISDFFEHVSANKLIPPGNVDISFGSAEIILSKSAADSMAELEVSLDHLEFDQWSAEYASLTISTSGILLRAALGKRSFDEVTLENAAINVFFAKDNSTKSPDIFLTGTIDFPFPADAPETVSATVHLYRSREDSDSLDWTIYGHFTSKASFTLQDVIPGLSNSGFGQLGVSNVMLIVASRDDPQHSPLNPQQYSINRGVQLCAGLGGVPGFHHLLRSSPPPLHLSAGWSNRQFTLDLLLPQPINLHLGRGIVTDPISLRLQTNNPFQLEISAGVKVPVPKNRDPLDFEMILGLVAGTKDPLPIVTFTGLMSGYWRDPLGIGEQIQIGDKIMLSLVLVLPEFFATGLPSGFGFAGGISIGNTTLKTAVEISEDPEDELVVGSVHDLSITDGEALISTFTGIELPKAPNFLVYKNADVYLSTGVYLGNVFYPAGFSFDADILFCGVQLRAAGGVSNGVLKLKGDLSNFQVGPLTVKGVNHPHAILDLECSAALQKAHVDGVINIFHFIDIAIWLDIQLMPSPLFRFAFLLHFTDLLTFSVHAELTKSIEDFKDLTQLDFSLVAYFEQHLLDYIRDHVIDQLKNAKKNADEAVGAATSALDNAKAAFEKEIENAQSKLDAAYASWQKHAKQVHDASQAVIDAYNVKCKQLQNSVEEQRAQFHAKLKHAETSLQVTNAARAAKLKAAEADVTRAKQAWDHDIDVAEKSLRDAQAEMDRKFGSVERDIDHAEARVDSLQSQINDIQNTINDYENAHWYEFWKKAAIPGLEVAKGALYATKGVADGVLEAAKAVVEGADFLTCKGAIPLAESAVAEAGRAGDAAFQSAKAALEVVDKVTAEAVSAAEHALELVEKGGDALWKAAEATLQAFIDAGRATLKAAQKAIDDLVQSLEWLAYQAATAALAVAKHATHAIDVAKAALEVAQKAAALAANLIEFMVSEMFSIVDIQQIKVQGKLSAVVTEKQRFDVEVKLKLMRNEVPDLRLTLDMAATDKLVADIFESVIKNPVMQKQKTKTKSDDAYGEDTRYSRSEGKRSDRRRTGGIS